MCTKTKKISDKLREDAEAEALRKILMQALKEFKYSKYWFNRWTNYFWKFDKRNGLIDVENLNAFASNYALDNYIINEVDAKEIDAEFRRNSKISAH